MSSGLIMVVSSIDPFTVDSAVNHLRINLLVQPTRLARECLFKFGKIAPICPLIETAIAIQTYPVEFVSRGSVTTTHSFRQLALPSAL
jgi:hypothetical protein